MTTAAFAPALTALAAALPDSTVRPPVLLTADRRASRRSAGRTDCQPAGDIASVPARRDGSAPAGWGITTTGAKVRDQATEEWMLSYTIRAPQTDAERAEVVAFVSARWIAEAQRVADLGVSDGADDRALPAHDARVASLRALIAAAQVAL